MSRRFLLLGVLVAGSLLFAYRAPAQSKTSGGSVIPTATVPSDSSITTQGGLLVSVVGENKTPLDRQAVIKAYSKDPENKDNPDVKWQTTGYNAEATVAVAKAGVYEVEVSAVGYLTSTMDVNVPTANTVYQVHVTLQKDPSAIEFIEPSAEQMPGKVRKEVSRGIADLKSGKLKAAQKHLNGANQLLPSDAEVKFLLGYLFFQEKDFERAETELTAACTLHPHNVQARTLLARVQIQRADYDAARKTLETAIEADPRYWTAHDLLADIYLNQQDYEKARTQAQLAIDNGNGAEGSTKIVLGQALEGLGQNDEALKVYKSFVKNSPSSPMASQVRTLYDELAQRINGQPAGSASAKKTVMPAINMDMLFSSSEPGLLPKTWGPPGVDDVKPVMAEGVVCPFDQVIGAAGERIKQLVDDVGRFNAIEELTHEDLNELDRPITRTVLKFNYVASISEPEPGLFAVGEFRDERAGADDFPDRIATRGLPALALIFHPDERPDFQMSCEGLGDWRGKATWLVRFEQLQNRPHRIQEYKIAGHSYPVSLKGRAWISADTFHIVHLESDLMSPIPEIQLLSEHLDIDYGPVMFQKKNVELWLPKSAEIYFDFRRHHYLRRHSFDHFMLFSVDADEKRSEPGAKKGHTVALDSAHPTS
jgi:tetratricopeptide (TPR) repeat protein